MDIPVGLLYQEYQRFTGSQGGGHGGLESNQQQQRRHGSTTETILFRTIQQSMPSVLAPCSPRSSRVSASPAFSASDDQPEEEKTVVGKTVSPARQQLQQRYSQIADVGSPTASRRAQQLQQPAKPPPPATKFDAAEQPTERGATARNSLAPDSRPGGGGGGCGCGGGGGGGGRQNLRTVVVDTAGGRGRGQQLPLVVIDPKDVKSVLTQVVTSTMRDLLGRDQDARERCLLRQIKRTLGEFQTSMSAIVGQFAAAPSSRHQQPSASLQWAGPAVNNSAGNSCGATASRAGAGVCTQSKDSGRSIRESCCCQSEDRTTGSTRVALVESDVDYRPTTSQSCSGCASPKICHQKNFNHAAHEETASGDILAPICDSTTVFQPSIGLTFPKFRAPAARPPARRTQPKPQALKRQ